VLALCCVVAAVLVLILAPTPQAAPKKKSDGAGLGDVLKHPVFRETAGLVLVPHMVFFGIQGLWIGRWLTDVGRFSEQGVAWLLYLGMGAVIVGAIAVGKVTEWAARRGIDAITVACLGVLLFVVVQWAFVMGWQPGMPVLAVLVTLVGTITGIEYTIVAQAMPPALTGRASTCLNLLIFTGAFAVQAGFGLVVGLWQPDAAQHYPAAAYQAAFFVLVLLQLPGLACHFRRRRGSLLANAVESPL
jgi:predicted MFS family arabinose efflux permease